MDGIRLSPSRNIAGNIYKFAFCMAFGADIRGSGAHHSKTACPAPPVSHTASRTNIADKSFNSGMSTLCAHPYIVFIFHLSFLLYRLI
jgi:hypothetical protein